MPKPKRPRPPVVKTDWVVRSEIKYWASAKPSIDDYVVGSELTARKHLKETQEAIVKRGQSGSVILIKRTWRKVDL